MALHIFQLNNLVHRLFSFETSTLQHQPLPIKVALYTKKYIEMDTTEYEDHIAAIKAPYSGRRKFAQVLSDYTLEFRWKKSMARETTRTRRLTEPRKLTSICGINSVSLH